MTNLWKRTEALTKLLMMFRVSLLKSHRYLKSCCTQTMRNVLKWKRIWAIRNSTNSNRKQQKFKMYRISDCELVSFGIWERRASSWYFWMSSLFLRDISHIKDGKSRGDKEFLIKDDESISFSVAIAFSHLRIYGCLITCETITSEEIK